MSSTNVPTEWYTIPDFLANCPFNLRVNPHYDPLAKESYSWLDSFGVHSTTKHKNAFEAMDFGLLTAMCYPDADADHFKVVLNFINALFAFDDLTDEGVLRKDGEGTRKASDLVMSALYFPTTFKTNFKVGKVFASFWASALKLDVPFPVQRRFLEYTDLYVSAVHKQVKNRAENKMLGIEEFIRLRRDTGALKMCFAMGEFALALNIPDEVLEHPLIKIMEDAANDIVVLSNDIYSYCIEAAQGDTMNIIETTMREKDLSVQGAIDYAGDLVRERINIYVTSKAQLPQWDSACLADDVRKYCDVMECWCVAGFDWNLTSTRYFGAKVEEVRKTLKVQAMLKQEPRGQEVVPGL